MHTISHIAQAETKDLHSETPNTIIIPSQLLKLYGVEGNNHVHRLSERELTALKNQMTTDTQQVLYLEPTNFRNFFLCDVL
jgi:hypothetical protein